MPSYSKVEDGRIQVQGQSKQKLARPSLKIKPGMVMYVCDARYLGGRHMRTAV
jgi:hypothetical protein